MRRLKRFERYTRKEAHDILEPNTKFVRGTGSWGLQGIISLKNNLGDYVFFVTYGSKQGEHVFEEGITSEGVLTWQSQPKQKLKTPTIRKLIKHNEFVNNIYLFLRESKKDPYIFLGTLAYLEYDNNREEPVYFKWQILDWELSEFKHTGLQIDLKEDDNSNADERVREKADGIYDCGSALLKTPPPSNTKSKRSGVNTENFKSGSFDYEKINRGKDEFGEAGEEAVILYEKESLIKAGREDLAKLVVSTRMILGNNAPYDILSFTIDGKEKYIEVKTTKGNINSPFFISSREVAFSDKYTDQYYLCRVYNFDKNTKTGKFFIVKGCIKEYCNLDGINFKATFK